jgi:HAD superfamily hydrolase (TIGR01509 family)
MALYGLIFDVDGVLADSEALIARATGDMFRELYGIEVTPDDFRPFIGTGAVRYTVGPAEAKGVEITDLDAALQRRADLFEKLIETEDLALPGALDLIEAAAASGEWKLGIATSSPADKSRKTVDKAGVPLELFSAYINGDMVTHKKPDPEIYEVAASALGISPRNCVVVEDSVAGVQAAKSAGMKCVAVTNSFSRAELSEADLIVDSLEAVTPDTLRGLLTASCCR